MKKIFILLAVVSIAATANAQWFLGGSLGVNVNVEGSKDREKLTPYKSEIGFSIAPKFGYYFNEKIAFGVDLAIGPKFVEGTQTTIYYPPFGTPYEHKIDYQGTYVQWRAAPFLRYSVFTYKKFALMLEGSVGVGGQHATLVYEKDITEKVTVIGVGIINIVPVLGFKLTDRLQFEAELNFLNIGYNLDINMFGEGNSKDTYLKHDLNIGFNAKSVLVMTQLRIGVIYRF
jgi:hypothetical protein